MNMDIPRLDITVGETPKDGMLTITRHIRPSWTTEKIVIKDVKGGHVNRLYSCGLEDDVEENDVLLFRVYGSGVDGMTDREKEILAMRIGHRVDLAAPIYCRFNNGIVHKYQRGCKVDFSNQTEEPIARGIARDLALFHNTDVQRVLSDLGQKMSTDKFKSCFCFSDFLPTMVLAVPEKYDNKYKEKVRKEELMTKADVLAEVRRLDKSIRLMDFPLVFCHNDMNTGNILYDRSSNRIHFLDWEFVDMGNSVNDIAIYFNSHTFSFDVKCHPNHLLLFPDNDYQLKWIRWYLEYSAEFAGRHPHEVHDKLIHNMYRGVNLAAMRNCLCLCQWCLGQDISSHVQFDFFGLAKLMQELYWLIKRNMEAFENSLKTVPV